MNRHTIDTSFIARAHAFAHAFALALALTTAAACTAEPGPLSWEEFLASAHRVPETGTFVFDRDDVAHGRDELRAAYDRYLADAEGVATADRGLAILFHEATGRLYGWSPSRKLNLSSCIRRGGDERGFSEAEYAALAGALSDAAADWESAAYVDFRHESADDGPGCNETTSQVFFNVTKSPQDAAQPDLVARAFYPNEDRDVEDRIDRQLAIYAIAFTPPPGRTLTGMMRHELGHILGFRHEHVRPESGCPDQDGAGGYLALTAYDHESVMHYRAPTCPSGPTGDNVLTALDRAGAAMIYGEPPQPRASEVAFGGMQIAAVGTEFPNL